MVEKNINNKNNGFGISLNLVFIIIIIVIVIVSISVIYLLGVFSPHITVTAIDLVGHNIATGQLYNGNTTQSGFSTKAGTIFYKNIWAQAIGTTLTIKNFTSNTLGFTIVSVSPKLPINQTANSNVTYTLGISVPDSAYTGALSITLDYS